VFGIVIAWFMVVAGRGSSCSCTRAKYSGGFEAVVVSSG